MSLCWLVENRSVSTDGDAPLQELFVPRDVSWLVFDGDAPKLAPRGSGLRCETVVTGGRTALLVETPPQLRARIDGCSAPRLALLDVRSEVQLEQAVLHLTRFDDCAVGPPPAELVGTPCPVCTLPVEAGARVRVHDCGRALHQDPDTVPEADRLECALLSDACAHCGQAIAREPGFAWRP